MSPILTMPVVEFAAAASGSLFSAGWEGAVLVAGVAVALRSLPRLSAAARSAIWLNVFALLVLLHFAPVLRPASGVSSPAASPVHMDLRWSLAIFCAWALLSLWRAGQLALSARSLRRIANNATPVSVPGVQDLLAGDTARRAELCTSTDVERPCVVGFFRPRILMPPALIEALTPAELRQVLLHETEHLHRGDDWSNLVQKLALALFPLNPALFWVERRLCAERELACDDRVLRSSSERKSYALCLTRLAEYSMLQRGISLVLGAFGRKSELVGRVHRILSRPRRSMSSRAAMCASAGMVAAAIACTVGLARSPELISFVPPAASPLQAENQLPPGYAPHLTKAILPASAASIRPGFLNHPALKRVPVRRATPAPSLLAPEIATRAPLLPSVAQQAIVAQPVIARQRNNAQQQAGAASTFEGQVMGAAMPSEEFVVLTEWSSTDAPPQVVIAVERAARPHYAAVPVANGWLIVQI